MAALRAIPSSRRRPPARCCSFRNTRRPIPQAAGWSRTSACGRALVQGLLVILRVDDGLALSVEISRRRLVSGASYSGRNRIRSCFSQPGRRRLARSNVAPASKPPNCTMVSIRRDSCGQSPGRACPGPISKRELMLRRQETPSSSSLPRHAKRSVHAAWLRRTRLPRATGS